MPGLPPGHGREARRKRRGRIGVIGRRTHADSGLRGSRSPMRWKCVTASGRLIRRWDLHRRGSFSRVVARVLAGTISQAHSARAPANYAFAQARAERTNPSPARSPSPDTAKPNSSATFGLSSRRCEEEQLNAAAPRSGLRRSPAPLVHTGPGSTAGSNPLGQAVLAVLTCGGRRAVTVVIPFPSQRSNASATMPLVVPEQPLRRGLDCAFSCRRRPTG